MKNIHYKGSFTNLIKVNFFSELFYKVLAYPLMLSIIYFSKNFSEYLFYTESIYKFRNNLYRILEQATHLINMLTRRDKSSSSGEFFEKGVLQICSEFTGEHPCRSKDSIKLHWKFSWYLLNTSGELLLEERNVTYNINICSLKIYTNYILKSHKDVKAQ